MALLALEDGTIFYGKSIGVKGNRVGEVVFNTSMTGYQEILTDPSYAQQIIVFTCPHIGNTGVNQVDEESQQIYTTGLVVRNFSLVTSNWRSSMSLGEYLVVHNVVAISDVDTRALTIHLRTHGSLNGCIMSDDVVDEQVAINKAKKFKGIKNMDLAKVISTTKTYKFVDNSPAILDAVKQTIKNNKFKVVVYDYGVKKNILNILANKACELIVVNAQTQVKKVLAMNPDGVFLSNGAGDPEPCDYAIDNIKALLKIKMPLFGICLGYQLLALASGAKIKKMKFGHHGSNHPVQDLNTKQVVITAQNHNFIVDEESIPDCLQITHRSLFDNSIQGLRVINSPAFGFQGHPEASPGPHDTWTLFDNFINDMCYEKYTN